MVTKEHRAPFFPWTPTGHENFFRKTILFSSDLWRVVTSGLRKVSSTIFQTVVSQVDRKRLFPCSPGYMWFALICSFTLLSVLVISCIQLLVDDAISLQRSLELSICLFWSNHTSDHKFPLLNATTRSTYHWWYDAIPRYSQCGQQIWPC